MTPTKGVDVSTYQAPADWNTVKAAGYEIAIVKMSGGDAGLYMDPKCGIHYNGARNAGLAVGGYHFAGGGDPIAEADYFLRVVSPLDENQVLVLDWEIQHANPVDWVGQFVQHVHDSCGVWPIVYMNGSTANAYNWNGDARVNNCGKWIAWYGVDPNSDLAVHEPYIAHQYSSTTQVPGISGNVDVSDWWIDVATFNKYGYHEPQQTPQAAPTPAPAPAPVPEPAPHPTTPGPQPQPQPVPEPVATPPAPQPTVNPTPAPAPVAPVITVVTPPKTVTTVSIPVKTVPASSSWVSTLLAILSNFLKWIKS